MNAPRAFLYLITMPMAINPCMHVIIMTIGSAARSIGFGTSHNYAYLLPWCKVWSLVGGILLVLHTHASRITIGQR